jgi:hypothetical protein
MPQIDQHIFPIDVINVAIVGISPILRPRIRQREPVSAILKPRLPFHHGRLHSERVLTPKMRPEFIVRDFLPLLPRRPRRMISPLFSCGRFSSLPGFISLFPFISSFCFISFCFSFFAGFASSAFPGACSFGGLASSCCGFDAVGRSHPYLPDPPDHRRILRFPQFLALECHCIEERLSFPTADPLFAFPQEVVDVSPVFQFPG